MSDLPDLDFSEPYCTGCFRVTENNGDGYACFRCKIFWHHDNYYAPEFLDETDATCGYVPSTPEGKKAREEAQEMYRLIGYVKEYESCSLPMGHLSRHYYPATVRMIREENEEN